MTIANVQLVGKKINVVSIPPPVVVPVRPINQIIPVEQVFTWRPASNNFFSNGIFNFP